MSAPAQQDPTIPSHPISYSHSQKVSGEVTLGVEIQGIITLCLFIQMSSKIVKANGAQPDEFELSVATEFANLEVYGSFI